MKWTAEQRDRMSPGQILEELKKGNERFRAPKNGRSGSPGAEAVPGGRSISRSDCAGMPRRASACRDISMRASETRLWRIASSVVNDDLLGSTEFACAVAGAKVVLVFGHTACGEIKGAVEDVEMGNLTGASRSN